MRRTLAILAALGVLSGLVWVVRGFALLPGSSTSKAGTSQYAPNIRPHDLPPAPTLVGRAEDTASPVPGDEAKPITLRVHVQDEEGRPIGGAHLWVRGESVGATSTDGSAIVTWSEPFSYVVTVAPGFVAGEDELSVADGGTLLVELRRGAVLEGRVVEGGTGKPIENARVLTGKEGHADGAEAFPWFQEATTDATGRFRLDSLGTDDARLWVEARGWSRARARIHVTDDGRVDPEHVLLEVRPAGWLAARVTRSNGAPAASALLILQPEGVQPFAPGAYVGPSTLRDLWFDSATLLATTDERGHALIPGLPFGARFTLSVCDTVEADVAAPPTVHATAEVPEILLERRLRAPATLHLRCSGIEPAAVASVDIEIDGQEAPQCTAPGPRIAAATGVVPGHHAVVATAPDHLPVALDADFGEGTTVERDVTFEPGSELSGVVVDDRPRDGDRRGPPSCRRGGGHPPPRTRHPRADPVPRG